MNVKVKRLIACYIDSYLFLILASYLGRVFLFIEMSLKLEKFEFPLYLLFLLLVGSMYSLKDLIFHNQSIGKKIMNLKIYDENREIVNDKKLLFKRVFYSVFSFSFPLYFYMILYNNKSTGDKKLNLTVK